jgi:hypothetical protein
MEPLRSTDYFAVIPKDGAPIPVPPKPVNDRMFHWRMGADLFLLAVILGAAAIVVSVILNWSH